MRWTRPRSSKEYIMQLGSSFSHQSILTHQVCLENSWSDHLKGPVTGEERTLQFGEAVQLYGDIFQRALIMMSTLTSTQWVKLLVVAYAILGASNVVIGADPDPLQDFCVADLSPTAPRVNGFPCKPRNTVSAKDFTFTGLRQPAFNTSVSETGAIATLATVNEFPGLNTHGVSHLRLDFAVGGVVPLHTHPLAAETLFVLKGSIYTGFISADNVLYASTLQQGDFTIFPRALSHFQLNVGNETAITFNTLTSQNPGFLLTANQIFVPNITSAVIEKSFGASAATVKDLKSSIPRYWG